MLRYRIISDKVGNITIIEVSIDILIYTYSQQNKELNIQVTWHNI